MRPFHAPPRHAEASPHFRGEAPGQQPARPVGGRQEAPPAAALSLPSAPPPSARRLQARRLQPAVLRPLFPDVSSPRFSARFRSRSLSAGRFSARSFPPNVFRPKFPPDVRGKASLKASPRREKPQLPHAP